jgi:hypothetical protein
MECPSCGANLRDNAVFCSSCGQRITQQTVQTRIPQRSEGGGWETGPAPGAPPPGPAPGPAPGGQFGGQPAGPFPGGGGRGGQFGAGGGPPPGGTRAAGPDFNLLLGRITRLLRLDTTVFRELKGDQTALIPSLAVAAAAILIMALGGWLWWLFEIDIRNGKVFAQSVIIGTILGFGLWVGWVWLTSFILTQLFKRPVDFVTLLPPLGLATIPFAFGVLVFIGQLHVVLGIAAVVAGTISMQVAFQETTDAPPGEVLAANFAGFLLWAVVLSLLASIADDRYFAPGIWLFT